MAAKRSIAGLMLHEDGHGSVASHFYFKSGTVSRSSMRRDWEELVTHLRGGELLIMPDLVSYMGRDLVVRLVGKRRTMESKLQSFRGWTADGMPVRKDVGFTRFIGDEWAPGGADVYWFVGQKLLLTVGPHGGEMAKTLVEGLRNQYGLERG